MSLIYIPVDCCQPIQSWLMNIRNTCRMNHDCSQHSWAGKIREDAASSRVPITSNAARLPLEKTRFLLLSEVSCFSREAETDIYVSSVKTNQKHVSFSVDTHRFDGDPCSCSHTLQGARHHGHWDMLCVWSFCCPRGKIIPSCWI